MRYVNDAFARLIGRASQELTGHPFAELVPEGAEHECLALLDRVYRTGNPEVLEEQLYSQAPATYWTYSAWAILSEDESPMGLIIQITDATEIARFRYQVVAMNGQLLLSGTQQHELREKAERANFLKDEFLATISHELRTPLGVIVGWADVLKNSKVDADLCAHAVEVIQRNAQIQVQLIDDLLDISRIIAGKLRLKLQPTDLNKVILAAVESMRPAAKAKGVFLELQLDSSIGPISGDSDRLQQVAWNLISNAIKFTPKDGRVLVEVKRVDSHLELNVIDTGQGITPEFLPHVFDRFRQADSTSTRTYGGLGLGMAITRQLVELHGGEVRVASDGIGLGATFTVCLPLITPPGAESEAHSTPHPEHEPARSTV